MKDFSCLKDLNQGIQNKFSNDRLVPIFLSPNEDILILKTDLHWSLLLQFVNYYSLGIVKLELKENASYSAL